MYQFLKNLRKGGHRDIFEEIYTTGAWTKRPKLLDMSIYKTAAEFLSEFLAENNIRSIVEVGCGLWLPKFKGRPYRGYMLRTNLKGISYTGIDVVQSVVDRNNKKHGGEKVCFTQGNILEIDPPSADLLILAHILQHWSNEDILRILPKLSKYRHVLVWNSHHRDDDAEFSGNESIQTGPGFRYRGLRLDTPPFNLKCTQVLRFGNGKPFRETMVQVTPPPPLSR